MEEECVEKLMGHDTGVKEHYDRHLPNPTIGQYLRAMPYFFISEVCRNEAKYIDEIEKLKKEKTKRYTEMKLRHVESDNEIRKRKDQQAELINTIKRLGRVEEMATS